ncbi:hypothetical protein PG997_008541 [Apiospora hydei]|uniref:Uncharacterized protein n=1 Tax=Apiospora hydei TaxID=1337664 RepID=A0ABR1WBB0_9PEZI
MGKNPATPWPWPRAATNGSSSASTTPRGYTCLVGFDFFRQTQCLDNLRRAALPLYYNISAGRASYSASGGRYGSGGVGY